MANKKKKKSTNVQNTNAQNVDINTVVETTEEVSSQPNENLSKTTSKQEKSQPKKENQSKQKAKKVKKERTTPKLVKKVKETTSELKKVTWPTFGTVVKKTGVVLTVVIVFGLVLFGIDRLLAWLFELLTTSIA